MDIKNYFSELGDEVAAKKFDITERTARSYRSGQRKPRPNLALKIVKASKGRVKIEDIYK